MFKTAKNIALDHVKRAESVLTDAAENEDDYHFGELNGWGDEPYQRVSSNNEFELFCKSVRMLPRQCRRTFVLKKVYGYSQKEIAQQLNISERTVQKHVATGILRCGFYMNKHTDYGKKVAIKQADSSNSRGGNSRVSEHLRDED